MKPANNFLPHSYLLVKPSWERLIYCVISYQEKWKYFIFMLCTRAVCYHVVICCLIIRKLKLLIYWLSLNHFNGLWLITYYHTCPTVWIIQRELLARSSCHYGHYSSLTHHSMIVCMILNLYNSLNLYRMMIWRAFVIENGKDVNLQILDVISTKSHANLMAVWRRLFSSVINLVFQTSHWSKCIPCRMFPS